MPRAITHHYVDPLAQLWLGAARQIGLRVIRTPDAYATTDGRGTLAIGRDDALDADDSLAQMIFHELCHSLVEGEASFARADWGMDNTGPDHDWREHACLRAQWVLAGRHGLRGVFAPTTDFRVFWDTLSGDVLAARTEPSVQAAITALQRAEQPPWAPHLIDALAATARIAADVAATRPEPPSLWALVEPAPAPHPTGLPAGARDDATCASCAWRYEHRGRARCRQADVKAERSEARGGDPTGSAGGAGPRPRGIDDAWRACERYEPALDCQACGACCRAAYDSVEVRPRDRVIKAQPSYVVDRGTYLELRRAGDRCAALEGGPARYHCAIYDDRPRTCRDFTRSGEHCLTARRRVGLTL